MIDLRITADSAEDFLQQFAQVAGALTFAHHPLTQLQQAVSATQNQPADVGVSAVGEQQPKPRGRKPKAEAEPQGNAEETAAPTATGTGSTTETKDDAPPAEETQTEVIPASSEADNSKPLDFDTDVAPVVLGYVRTKGKPWVVEILSQFGVERASEIVVDQLPEFLSALRDAAGE